MPGTSGILSPFGKIDGLYFNNSREPDAGMYELEKDIEALMKQDGVEYITIHCDNKEDYYNILDKIVFFNFDSCKVLETSKNDYDLIIEPEEVNDETEDSYEEEVSSYEEE